MEYYMDLFRVAFYNMEVTPLSAVIKLLISFAMGAAVGIERQIRRQSAGMRTFTLICMGSTAAMLLSIWIPQSYPHFLNGDPGRIAAQVLTGIGFLGAGSIIQSRGSIHGLTTAASVWMIAVVGLCIGAGMYFPALAGTTLAIVVLVVFERLEKRKNFAGDVKFLTLHLSNSHPDTEMIRQLILQHCTYIFSLSVEKNFHEKTTHLVFKIQVNSMTRYKELFNDLETVEGMVSAALSD